MSTCIIWVYRIVAVPSVEGRRFVPRVSSGAVNERSKYHQSLQRGHFLLQQTACNVKMIDYDTDRMFHAHWSNKACLSFRPFAKRFPDFNEISYVDRDR